MIRSGMILALEVVYSATPLQTPPFGKAIASVKVRYSPFASQLFLLNIPLYKGHHSVVPSLVPTLASFQGWPFIEGFHCTAILDVCTQPSWSPDTLYKILHPIHYPTADKCTL